MNPHITKLREVRDALAYARRFLKPIDHDVMYVDKRIALLDSVIGDMEASGLIATDAKSSEFATREDASPEASATNVQPDEWNEADVQHAIHCALAKAEHGTHSGGESFDVLEAIRPYLRLPMREVSEEWRPIETAPKDGTRVIVTHEKVLSEGIIVREAKCIGGIWYMGQLNDAMRHDALPIGWKPMPEGNE